MRIVRAACCLALVAGVASAGRKPAAADEVHFGPRTTIAAVPDHDVGWIDVADVDGDGDADLVTSFVGDLVTTFGFIGWYPNLDGRGTFGSANTLSSTGAFSLLATDLDDDGDPDVISSLFFTASWWENGGNGAIWTQRPLSNIAAESFDAGDIDGDGHTDAVSTNNGVHWHESDGATPPGFTTHAFVGTDPILHAVAVDIDGDDALDLLAVAPSVSLLWLENDGATAPGFAPHVLDTPGGCPAPEPGIDSVLPCTRVRAADVDGDGDVDVVLPDPETLVLSWYESDGSSPPVFTRRPIAAEVPIAQVGDVDGDGDVDVLAQAGGQIAWFDNDGQRPPGWTPRAIGPQAAKVRDLETADLDGDGDLDVLAAAGDEVVWFENLRAAAIPGLPAVALGALAALLVGSARLGVGLGRARGRTARR
jgi:hypothetical protein